MNVWVAPWPQKVNARPALITYVKRIIGSIRGRKLLGGVILVRFGSAFYTAVRCKEKQRAGQKSCNNRPLIHNMKSGVQISLLYIVDYDGE